MFRCVDKGFSKVSVRSLDQNSISLLRTAVLFRNPAEVSISSVAQKELVRSVLQNCQQKHWLRSISQCQSEMWLSSRSDQKYRSEVSIRSADQKHCSVNREYHSEKSTRKNDVEKRYSDVSIKRRSKLSIRSANQKSC